MDIIKYGQTGTGLLIEKDAGYINKELNNSNKIITESFDFNPEEPVIINCVLQKYGVPNRNNRIYPEEILKKQVEAYQEAVANNSAISEADHPECVQASESQIFTNDGWKYFDEISNDEHVYTLNTDTNQVEIQQISKKIYQEYSGDMYKISHRNMDVTVTPNHRILLENTKGERFYITAEELYRNRKLYETHKILKTNKNNKIKSYKLNNKLNIKQINVEKEMIGCVTTPNSNFYVMVNGKSHWTGNSTEISLLNVSHLIKKMWWGNSPDDKHILYGQLRLVISPGFIKYGIPTMIGDKIVVYLQHDIRIGISSRGVGSLSEKSGKYMVENDFELLGFDLVATPSTFGAYLFPNKNQQQMGENIAKNDDEMIVENKKIKAINNFLL